MRVLWAGDAIAATGFGTVTHGVLDELKKLDWDIHVLGINYSGDPHDKPYRVYPAAVALANAQDYMGIQRLRSLYDGLKPDVVCLFNDIWVIERWLQVLPPEAPVVLYFPVDSPSFQPHWVPCLMRANRVAVFTDWARRELLAINPRTPVTTIPHGGDTMTFHPQIGARQNLTVPEDWYIVGNVNRNQPRKRLDLTVELFSRFTLDKPDSRLWLHCAVRDEGWNIEELVRQAGIEDRLIMTSRDLSAAQGVTREVLAQIYNCFDLHISTTLGEGWGLTNHEAALVGVPQVVPDWAALGEIFDEGRAYLAPIKQRLWSTSSLTTPGGLVDVDAMLDLMNQAYHDRTEARRRANLARAHLLQRRFQWPAIAKQFDRLFREVIVEQRARRPVAA